MQAVYTIGNYIIGQFLLLNMSQSSCWGEVRLMCRNVKTLLWIWILALSTEHLELAHSWSV